MEKEVKVYVVTEGIYSDREIVAIFSTKEKADKFCRAHRVHKYKYYTPEVTGTFILDSIDVESQLIMNGFNVYTVFMDEDGKVTAIEHGNRFTPMSWFVRTYFYDGEWHNDELYLESSQWAKSEEHAVKIVNERRLSLIANGMFTSSSGSTEMPSMEELENE